MMRGQTRWWGPPIVALGAGLWGVETLFRVSLQKFFTNDSLVFYEHLIASVLVLPIFLWGLSRAKSFRFSVRTLLWLLVSGILGSALGTVFFTSSLQTMNITLANVLLNLQPLVSVSFAAIALRERLARGFWPWAVLAIGCGMILSFEELNLNMAMLKIENPQGLKFVFGTILCWGIATVAGRAVMIEMPLSLAAPLRFFIGIFGTLFVVIYNGHTTAMMGQSVHLASWLVMRDYLLLLLVAGATPLFLYFYGLKYTGAMPGAFCEMAQTLFAVAVTWLVMGVPLKAHQVIAGVLLMAAVTMINVLQAKKSI